MGDWKAMNTIIPVDTMSAMAAGEIVWAKNTSRSSTSDVMSETRLPLSRPSSLAGASLRITANRRSRTRARTRNAR